MTQPPTPGARATGATAEPNGKPADDGFGPTRFERSANAAASTPNPTQAPPANGSAPVAPKQAFLTQATAPSQVAPPPARATKTAPPKSSRARGPRRARLQLRNINPWTVFKFSCVLGVFLFLVWLIVIMLLFGVLSAAGVISSVNNSVTTINGTGSNALITGGRVFIYGLIIGAINTILFIAIATVGSYVYNLCADLVGGIEVTLSERDG